MQPYWSIGIHDDYYHYLTEYISPPGDEMYLTSLKWYKCAQCNKADWAERQSAFQLFYIIHNMGR